MKTLTNLALLAVTVVLCLLAGEIAVRYIFADITTTRDNSSYFAQRWLESNPPSLNASGFREREYSIPKATGSYRIAIVGDSFTYGQGIVEDARFSNIIQRQLDNRRGHTEVLNFGRSGTETIDQINILDQYVLRTEPDFILLQWFINDVGGDRKAAQQHRSKGHLERFLHRHSALFYLANRKWRELRARIEGVPTYETTMNKLFSNPESQDSIRAGREMDELILRVKEKNIPMGIVLFPPLIEAGGSIEAYPYGYLFERLLSTCKRYSIQCLDLRPVFADVSPATKLWANRLDSHPGPLANELAASAILETFGRFWENSAKTPAQQPVLQKPSMQ